MAFQTGTSDDLEDLISDLLSFATTNGWTQDENDTVNGHVGFHLNSIYVQMRYDPADPDALSIYQSTAWDGAGTDPGAHTGDSGNGYNGPSSWSNTNARLERHVDDIGNGPYTYWFFEGDDANGTYLHVVVLVSTLTYRHFGFGELEKFGDWSGGEYVYGQHNVAAGIRTDQCLLLDGAMDATSGSAEAFNATIRMTGLPGQDGSSIYGQVWGRLDEASSPDDTAGNPKALVQGGFRGGPTAVDFGNLGGLPTTSGLLGPFPIELYYVDESNSEVYFLGHQPAVRQVNMEFFAPGDTVVIGSDTWYIFPASQKTLDNVTDSSNYLGIAYLRNNA